MYIELLQSTYSYCPDSSLERLVHVASSSSPSTATVQTAAWNSWYMQPAQALPLQPLSRQQPGTVGTCSQLKLFLNMHKTELYRKSLQHSGARNWNVLPDHIPRQSQIRKTKRRTLLSSTCSTFLPIYFILFCITCTLLAVICNSSLSVVSVLSEDKSFTAIIINSVANSSH